MSGVAAGTVCLGMLAALDYHPFRRFFELFRMNKTTYELSLKIITFLGEIKY